MTNLDRAKLANQIALDNAGKTAVETSLAIATAAQSQTPVLTDPEFQALTQTVNQFRGIFAQAIQQDRQSAAQRRPAPATPQSSAPAATPAQ